MRARTAAVRGSLAALVLAIALGSSACDRRAAPSTAPAVSIGMSLYEKEDYRAAAEALRAEYRAAPDATLKRALVKSLLSCGEPGEALVLLRGDASLPSAEAAMLRAEALLQLERPAEAEDEIGAFAKVAPAAAAYYRARASYAAGYDAQGLEELQSALRAGGVEAEAWMLRVRMALDANDFATAATASRRAVEAKAPASAMRALSIEAMIRSGAFDDAVAALGDVRKDASRPENGFLRVFLAAARGDFGDAANRLRAVEPALARTPRGRLLTAMVREGAGDIAQAESEFRRAASISNVDLVALDALAGFLLRKRDLAAAADIVNDMAAIDAASARPRRAAALAASGETDAAAEALLAGRSTPVRSTARILGEAAAGRIGPDQVETVVAVSNILVEGASGATGVRVPLPDDPVSMLIAGEAALDDGDGSAAAAAFGSAARASPRSARAMIGAARAVLALGDLAAARDVVTGAAGGGARNRLAAARVLLGEGRKADALALLRPRLGEIMILPGAVDVYVAAADGDKSALASLVPLIRRGGLADSDAAAAFLAAGEPAEAAAAARRSLLRGPPTMATLALYLEAAPTTTVGKAETAALVAALLRANPADTGVAEASRRLANGAPAADVARWARDLTGEKAWLRKAYLSAPENAGTTQGYALALLADGETKPGLRLLREACFWGAVEVCADARN